MVIVADSKRGKVQDDDSCSPHRATAQLPSSPWFPGSFSAVSLVQNVLNAVIINSFPRLGNVPSLAVVGRLCHSIRRITVPLIIRVVLSLWFIAPIGPDLHIAPYDHPLGSRDRCGRP
jgi:hypothetical protein